jgi:hypothetical protein
MLRYRVALLRRFVVPLRGQLVILGTGSAFGIAGSELELRFGIAGSSPGNEIIVWPRIRQE